MARTLHRGGLTVSAVRPDSPAARQGIRCGDVLVGMHKWETTKMDHVSYVLGRPEFVKLEPIRVLYRPRTRDVVRSAYGGPPRTLLNGDRRSSTVGYLAVAQALPPLADHCLRPLGLGTPLADNSEQDRALIADRRRARLLVLRFAPRVAHDAWNPNSSLGCASDSRHIDV